MRKCTRLGRPVMKINLTEPEKLLTFSPEEGKIFIKDTRVLVMNASAFGMLRKDLISALGWERARGFLTRYGWSCGENDAISANAPHNFMRDQNDYLDGPYYHTLFGHARVAPIKVKHNKKNNNWFFEGIWYNSYEAEQHLLHFSASETPVCWTLAGYAGGFRSACLGRQVIYKEIECIAQGHPHCRFIGKTREEWGEEIDTELSYYTENKIAEELEQAHQQILQQHKILQKSLNLHEHLTRMVLQGTELREIARTLGEVVGASIVITDRFLRVLADFDHHCDEATVRTLLFNIQSSTRDLLQAIDKSSRENMTLTLPRLSTEMSYPHCVAPITVGRENFGFLFFVKNIGPFNEFDKVAMEFGAMVCALEMTREKEVIEVERRLRGDYIDDLVNGNYTGEDEIITRGHYLGYNLNIPYHVLVLAMDNSQPPTNKPAAEKALPETRQQLLELISSFLKVHSPASAVLNKSDRFIILLATTDKTDPLKFARQLRQRLNLAIPELQLTAGIGQICHQPRDFNVSYKEATRVLEIMKAMGMSNEILAYRQLGVYSLLFDARNQTELVDFAFTYLQPLINYDAKHNSSLLTTLKCYLANGESLEKTAQVLNISVSGLKYRLARLREIGEINFSNTELKFNLTFALKIWETHLMVGEKKNLLN